MVFHDQVPEKKTFGCSEPSVIYEKTLNKTSGMLSRLAIQSRGDVMSIIYCRWSAIVDCPYLNHSYDYQPLTS